MTAARLNPYGKVLDEADVAAIRAELAARCPSGRRAASYAEIGARYGVTKANICKIAKGLTWKRGPFAIPSTPDAPAAAIAGASSPAQETASHA